MGKYYIKQIPVDQADTAVYYNWRDAQADQFWCGSGAKASSITGLEINEELFDQVHDNLVTAYTEFENWEEMYAEDEDYLAEEYVATIKRYFKKRSGDKLKNSEINQLIQLVYDYQEANEDTLDDVDVVCRVLFILRDKVFRCGWLPDDATVKYLCPETLFNDKSKIQFISAVLTNTGTEFQMTPIPIESIDEFNKFESYKYVYDYTYFQKKDMIKLWAANILGCTADQIEFYSDALSL